MHLSTYFYSFSKLLKLIRKSSSIKRLLSLALVLITAITIKGCNPALLKSDASQPPQLVQAILEGPKTFNPVIAQDATSSSIGRMIFAGLTEQNPFTGEIKPALA